MVEDYQKSFEKIEVEAANEANNAFDLLLQFLRFGKPKNALKSILGNVCGEEWVWYSGG